ncbi:MAG TPA: peptidoglycan DD-metalloendopeptidase family protein [Steroidobacteraceae bacterium]
MVRPNDTLYSIAWRHDLDFRDLARWNNIGADFRISVGQVLVLGPGREPSPETRTPQAAAKPAPAVPSAGPSTGASTAPSGMSPQVSKPRPLPESAAGGAPTVRGAPSPFGGARGAPANGAPANGASANGASANGASANGASANGASANASKWVWPTDRAAAPRAVPGGGILLSGRLGQDVRAASAGRVVYTGSGLRGYGNLVIIKHADSLLSAYAHNREMLVHDGQDVAGGQVIAHMGEGEGVHRSPVLYFEIRQNGRPMDPLAFLPR